MKEPSVQEWTVGELAENFQKKILSVNPEYQRGAVWDDAQCCMFLDSVLRRYYMPLIYLRQLSGEDRYEIIDGQQRISALWGFVYDEPVIAIKKKIKAKDTGGWSTVRRPIPPLFVPANEPSRFPEFLREQTCSWAGKKFANFAPELQGQLRNHLLSVVVIDGTDDETRDMFIRLQGGSVLTGQEIRDSWPGDFCDFVLNIGGKEPMERAGHAFFNEVFHSPNPDRGEVRQLVAQVFSLLLFHWETNGKFCSIQAGVLNERYRRHGNMRTTEDEEQKKRFVEILNVLHSCFKDVKLNQKLQNDDVIHLALLADSLLHESSSWQNGIVGALKKWREKVKRVKDLTKAQAGIPDELAPVATFNAAKGPSADKIKRRMEIFAPQMRELLVDGGYLRPTD